MKEKQKPIMREELETLIDIEKYLNSVIETLDIAQYDTLEYKQFVDVVITSITSLMYSKDKLTQIIENIDNRDIEENHLT